MSVEANGKNDFKVSDSNDSFELSVYGLKNLKLVVDAALEDAEEV